MPKLFNKIPPGGRRPGRVVAKRQNRRLEPIETLDEKGIRKMLPWLLPLVDIGSVECSEAEYWAQQRKIADREKREAAAKGPWTMVEWNELGPGLRSVIPRPRGAKQAAEEARDLVRRRQ